MRLLFSNKIYFALSLISALIIVFLVETDIASKVVGLALTTVVLYFSTLVFNPIHQERFPKPEHIVYIILIYLAFSFMGSIAIVSSSSMKALFFPSATASLIGMFFWVGNGIIVPEYERWRILREMQKEDERLKQEMKSHDVHFMDVE